MELENITEMTNLKSSSELLESNQGLLNYKKSFKTKAVSIKCNNDIVNINKFRTKNHGFRIPNPGELFIHLEKKRRKAIERDKKISRSLAILVIVFFLCWFPYTLIALIDAICLNRYNTLNNKQSSCVNSTLFEFAFWLLWLNSAINPFLYPFVQKSFRTAYKNMFYSTIAYFKLKCNI